jgi:hypothetical protein
MDPLSPRGEYGEICGTVERLQRLRDDVKDAHSEWRRTFQGRPAVGFREPVPSLIAVEYLQLTIQRKDDCWIVLNSF